MRYIDPEDVHRKIPQGWLERAQEALDEVRALAGDPDAVNARGDVWRDLKEILESITRGKCWYCESSQHRSDDAVDHYRPKNKNRKGEHNGYWWLAFDWRNLRYSCTYCNSRRKDEVAGTTGGKHDSFPLFNPEQRATREADNIGTEQPCLLDPAVPDDPGLLWYEPDGRVVPKYTKQEYFRRHLRADRSIELFHLNYYKTVEDRRVLYDKIRDVIEEGDKLFPKAESDSDLQTTLRLLVIKPLLNLIHPKSDFSAAARTFLLGFRDRPWVEGVLATA